MKHLPLKIRPIKSIDHPFIFDCWRKTVEKQYCLVDRRLFRTGINQVMETALSRSLSTHGGLVAHAPDDEDQIIGFQVVSVPTPGVAVIDFAFTKSVYWKLGVQAELFNAINETTKVIVGNFHTLVRREFHVDGKPFLLHLRDKYGIVFDPFFYERVG